jgi:hypothetical protein
MQAQAEVGSIDPILDAEGVLGRDSIDVPGGSSAEVLERCAAAAKNAAPGLGVEAQHNPVRGLNQARRLEKRRRYDRLRVVSRVARMARYTHKGTEQRLHHHDRGGRPHARAAGAVLGQERGHDRIALLAAAPSRRHHRTAKVGVAAQRIVALARLRERRTTPVDADLAFEAAPDVLAHGSLLVLGRCSFAADGAEP